MTFFVCFLVAILIGFGFGTLFGEWVSGPPPGFDQIEIPKGTKLMFDDEGLHTRNSPAYGRGDD